jgi:hypothetical protein
LNKRTKDLLVGSLAVGTIVIALYFAFGGRSPKINLDPYEVLGAVTAEETAKLLGNQGQVLVLVRDTGPDKDPSAEAELRAFQRTLKQHSGVKLVIERILVNPMLMVATGGGLPPEQLFKALQAYPKAGAVVLFFGFPQLGEPELEALKKSGVKTVVVSSLRTGYKQLLERRAIHLAIVPRPDNLAPTGPAPRTLRERFDQEYIIITPVEAAWLP